VFPYVKDRDSLSSFTGNGTSNVFPNVKDRDSKRRQAISVFYIRKHIPCNRRQTLSF
jgi:hypothetical protein